MVQRFNAARLKLRRAGEHVTNARTIISELPNLSLSKIEFETATRFHQLEYVIPNGQETAENLALIVGDAIHNFRTALDYAWSGVIEKYCPSALDAHTKFPFYSNKQDLESALKGRGIDAASSILFEAIVNHIKPYRNDGGNDFLCYLHDMDVRDKHNLMLPMVHYSSIQKLLCKTRKLESLLS
jgi:hypothetical protein